MPDIDVSEVFGDPLFTETLTVRRRKEVIGSNGRATTSERTYRPMGIVIPQDGGDLTRTPNMQTANSIIEVHTQFRLRGPSKDQIDARYQPDIVVWNGDPYVVVQPVNFSKYGFGFIRAVCASMADVDHAPETGEVPL